MKQIKELKLVTITRSDISYGYQVVQSCHSIADFADQFPTEFKKWKEDSNSIISLSAKSEQHLLVLFDKFSQLTPCVKFFEPDVNAYTSITLLGTPEVRKKLSHLSLIGKKQKETV